MGTFLTQERWVFGFISKYLALSLIDNWYDMAIITSFGILEILSLKSENIFRKHILSAFITMQWAFVLQTWLEAMMIRFPKFQYLRLLNDLTFLFNVKKEWKKEWPFLQFLRPGLGRTFPYYVTYTVSGCLWGTAIRGWVGGKLAILLWWCRWNLGVKRKLWLGIRSSAQ